MQRAIQNRRKPDIIVFPRTPSVLACIAIVLLVASAGPVSAGSVPQVAGISPSGGPTDGGTAVTVMGSGFLGAVNVTFGEKPGTSLTVVNDSILTVTAPANPAGTVEVAVTGPAGEMSAWDAAAVYMYEEVPRPRVTGISPSSGPVAGGTRVVITGSGFTGTTAVRFGEKYGSDLTVADDSHIRVTTPESFPGPVVVSVRNSVGTGNSPEPSAMFFYEFPFPELTRISPSGGPAAGGTVVTVTGSGLSGATDVRFGGISGTGLNVIHDRELTVIAPPNPAGTVGISVINPGHTGYSAGSASVFRYYVPVPEPAALSPASGPPSGGTVVTVTGSGFSGATSVTFGGRYGTNLTVIDDRHLTVTTPPSPPGLFPISITSPTGEGGSREPSAMFRYEFPRSATPSPETTVPAGDRNALPSLSSTETSPRAAAAPALPETPHIPGFGVIAGIPALVAGVLFRKISCSCTALPERKRCPVKK